MKYLKPFDKINESVWAEIQSYMKNKPYESISDTEYDDLRDEFDKIKGREEITERDGAKIKSIIDNYLRKSQTGFCVRESYGINDTQYAQRRYIQSHSIDLYFDTGYFSKQSDCRVNMYGDDYFIIEINIPVTTNSTSKSNFLCVDHQFFVIDGWDGFEEWSEKTSPFDENLELYKLLKQPIHKFKDNEYKPVSQILYHDMMEDYPHIRDWQTRYFYFFKDGKHFATSNSSLFSPLLAQK